LGGAAAGGIIGNQSGRGLEGAAIGAGFGALGGNVIGGSNDQRNNQYYNNRRRYY
jgi:outer membrane lipoprotein SlyB